MSALYLTNDLLFSSRVTSSAKNCHLGMRVVSNPTELLSQVEAGNVHFVLLDWNMPEIDLMKLIPQIRDNAKQPVSIVAFGPHVDVAAMAAAKQAGCDGVFTRGQFSNQLQNILQNFGCTT